MRGWRGDFGKFCHLVTCHLVTLLPWFVGKGQLLEDIGQRLFQGEALRRRLCCVGDLLGVLLEQALGLFVVGAVEGQELRAAGA